MPITPNDPADFTPTMKGYSGQGAFRFWCQTVLPLVYDDSLSYYELLNKVVVYLNNTISDVANMEDNVGGLYDAYVELQGYVNDYFASLDVQEEINNKLDDMASNGALSALLGPYVPPAVTEWLAENLYPTEPPIDKTLSIGNAAADSETVGNIFYEITDINNYMNPESRELTRNGLTIKYLQNGSIFINGQAEATTRYIYAQDIPIGSYKRGRIVLGGQAEGGTFTIEYRTSHSGNWTAWTSSATLNVASATYQFSMKIANGMSFTNWNQYFYIYPSTGVAPTEVYNRTAIDYIARNGVTNNSAAIDANIDYIDAKLFPITTQNNYISPEAISVTNNGMNFTFHKDGTVWLNGTAGEDGAFYTLINGFAEAGTYTWKYTRIANALTSGSFIVQTSSDGENWTRWAGGTNYTAAVGDLVRLNLAANTVASNVGYSFVFWNTSESEPQEAWANSAIDYYARELNYSCSDELEGGGMVIANGYVGHSYANFYNYRRQRHLTKITSAPIKIKINTADLDYVSAVNVFQYTSVTNNDNTEGLEFVRRQSGLTLVNGIATYHPDPEITHIKVTLAISDATHGYQPVEFFSSTPVYTVPNFNTITGDTYKSIEFNYEVSPGVWTKGQLLLPPNYASEGAKVPLMVYVHGTTRMTTWDAVLPGTASSDTDAIWKKLWDYALDEGFAVFDCYPWTSKYYSTSEQISPMPLDIHNEAYKSGIEYVCDRYNVNKNCVFAMCKSLGGSFGYMLMEERGINVNAIAMMAPSTLFTNPKTLEFFQTTTQRRPLLKYLGLDGVDGGSYFINTSDGMTNTTCVNFLKQYKDLFYPVSYATINAHGDTRDNILEWILGLVSDKPQWMTDYNIPDWDTSVFTHGMSEIVEHPELSKYTKVPVAYWYSWDDANASPHMAYTAFMWLQNGGSNVVWNVVPDNTGGHHSVDNSPDAVTVSGTTALGIAYTDVNKVWVDCVAFFRKYM